MNGKLLFRRGILALAIGFWAMGIGYGLHALYDHENRPGMMAAAPSVIPALDVLQFSQDKPRLLMFIHPQCPCTRASLRELDRLRSDIGQSKVDVAVVVMTGDAPQLQFANGLGMQAQQMTGIHVVQDPRGQLAASMGVWTSGQVLLYDAAGQLQFAGGITPSRGHEGNSIGRDMIRDIVLHDRKPDQPRTAVFGCAIQNPGQNPSELLHPISLNIQDEALPCCNP